MPVRVIDSGSGDWDRFAREVTRLITSPPKARHDQTHRTGPNPATSADSHRAAADQPARAQYSTPVRVPARQVCGDDQQSAADRGGIRIEGQQSRNRHAMCPHPAMLIQPIHNDPVLPNQRHLPDQAAQAGIEQPRGVVAALTEFRRQPDRHGIWHELLDAHRDPISSQVHIRHTLKH